jgi:hypothetical protein
MGMGRGISRVVEFRGFGWFRHPNPCCHIVTLLQTRPILNHGFAGAMRHNTGNHPLTESYMRR